MSLQCELSGELLGTSSEEAVVTPSGHICLKRLLLTKLTENGGMDPFHEERPLSEDQLVPLTKSKCMIVPPRPNQMSSMPGLLNALQSEYDALVLELFDARKALEETRRELSQALYQNDAAMRVVARVSMERDQARQQLVEWNAGAAVPPTHSSPPSPPVVVGPVPIDAEGGTGTTDETVAPSLSKKRKVEEDLPGAESSLLLPLTNDIPQEDLDSMVSVWETLHKGRKSAQKEAAGLAPKPEDLAVYTQITSDSWHQTICKGIVAMAGVGDKLVTAGKDKSILVYNTTSKKLESSFTAEAKAATCLDMSNKYAVAGLANGKVQVCLWTGTNGEVVGVAHLGSTGSSAVVSVHLHPDGQHILAASESGTVVLLRIGGEEGLTAVSIFKREEETGYTSGCLHPDGLIYVAGTSSGEILLWDLKSRSMAGSLKEGGGNGEDDAVVDINVSNSGYHIAAAYGSGKVCVWDLRKQKCIATLNYQKSGSGNGEEEEEKQTLEQVSVVAFDPSGKYLAYGGTAGVRIVTVKEWDTIVAAWKTTAVSGIVWGEGGWIAISSSQQPKANFYHKESTNI